MFALDHPITFFLTIVGCKRYDTLVNQAHQAWEHATPVTELKALGFDAVADDAALTFFLGSQQQACAFDDGQGWCVGFRLPEGRERIIEVRLVPGGHAIDPVVVLADVGFNEVARFTHQDFASRTLLQWAYQPAENPERFLVIRADGGRIGEPAWQDVDFNQNRGTWSPRRVHWGPIGWVDLVLRDPEPGEMSPP